MSSTSDQFLDVGQPGASELGLLRSLLGRAPLGFAFFDTESRFRQVNQTLADLDGYPAEDHVGYRARDILDPELADSVEDALRAVQQSDCAVADRELSGATPADSAVRRHWLSSWVPAHGRDGRVLGVAMFLVEVTELRRAHDELQRRWERYRSLAQASEQVVWVASPEGRIQEESPEWHAITGQSFEGYSGEGWLNAVHPDDRAEVQGAWQRALLTGSTFECGYRLRTRSGQYRNYSSRAVPIVRGGTILEWVGVSADVTAARDADVMRERLNEQLSAAALRTARLQQVTSMLAEAITVDEVARTVVEVGHFAIGADRTAVALHDRQRHQLRTLDQDSGGSAGDRWSWSPVDTPSVLSHVVREREAFVASSPEELRNRLSGARTDELAVGTDERAWVGVPLLTSGGTIGAIRFSFLRPRVVTDEEHTFLQAVAGQCALAVERAMSYEREHQTANTLQHSLLPGRLPEPPGIVLAARYEPAGHGLRIGGDWYDAFEVPDGRLAVVVGDVMGKGVEAAAGMGRVRSGLRALALSDPQPSAVLTGLDSLFAATEDEEQMTTVLYGLLDMASGDAVIGNAGHVPPLILSETTGPRLAPHEPGRPLGAPRVSGDREGRVHQRFHLAPSETAVVFSDGLVENRNRTVPEGLDELVAVAANAPSVTTSPESVLGHLFRHMLADYDQDDDVTLLALHVRPDGG